MRVKKKMLQLQNREKKENVASPLETFHAQNAPLKRRSNFNSGELVARPNFAARSIFAEVKIFLGEEEEGAEPGHKFAFLWNSLLSLVNSRPLAHPAQALSDKHWKL